MRNNTDQIRQTADKLKIGAMLKIAMIGGSLLALAACCAKTSQTPAVNMITGQMAPTIATDSNPLDTGMVAAANPHAVEAGLAALRAGGSAIDAALATQTVLSLVEPQSSGIGGGAFLIYYDAKTGKVSFYNGRETAPANIDHSLFQDKDGNPIRRFEGVVSGISTGVPSVISMLEMAHTDHGKIPWAKGFDHAISLSEDGFAVSARMAALVKMVAKWGLKVQPAARDYFFDDKGEPIPEGFIRDNKPYARALRAIAANPKAMYEGPLAQEIIDVIHQEPRPGTLTLADLAAYRPQKSEALCSAYRQYIVCGPQAPSSGGVAVQSILGQLENFDMKTLGPSLQGWHVFTEASELAYADRDLYVADPDFVSVPSRELLEPDYLKSRAALIQMDRSLKDVKAGDPVNFRPGQDATPDQKGTSHLSIVDQWGNVVSMTTTVEAPFGSERMASGFMLNNQLTDFSFRSHDAHGNPIANRPEPRKRPRSSMAPHIIFHQDGRFAFATGSPGGSSIIAYTAKSIIALIDWGMTPQQATALANVISRNGSVRLEENNLSPEIIEGLEALGHKVVRSKGEISGIHIIRKNPDGKYEGGADTRREGQAKSQ